MEPSITITTVMRKMTSQWVNFLALVITPARPRWAAATLSLDRGAGSGLAMRGGGDLGGGGRPGLGTGGGTVGIGMGWANLGHWLGTGFGN